MKLPGAPIAINQSGSTVKSIDKKETNQDNMEDCLFCKWKNEKEKIIIENDLAFARPDEFAVSPGHTLFMTKKTC